MGVFRMSRRDEGSRQFELNGVTRWLVRRAARRAPESLSSRLEEEWLADSESRYTALSGLRFALGCWWAAVLIANEFSRNYGAALTPTARGVPTLADGNSGYLSLRSATLFLIVGFHAAALIGGLSLALPPTP
jgi:hypothetical protein